MIASKQRVIDAHNDDAQASIAYVSAVMWNKETRKLEDLKGANTEICNGEIAGDAGWDPLRLADTKTHLLVYREAEVKHGARRASAAPHRPHCSPPCRTHYHVRVLAWIDALGLKAHLFRTPPHALSADRHTRTTASARNGSASHRAPPTACAGRLAMLAAAGWPISELVPHGSGSILQDTARAARAEAEAPPQLRWRAAVPGAWPPAQPRGRPRPLARRAARC